MREERGDLWTWDDGQVLARVITTNGYVTKDGNAVLGRGVAKQAVDRFGEVLKAKLGEYLQLWGNIVHAFPPNEAAGRPYWLVTFPVKPAEGPDGTPGFRCKAEPDLIRRSAYSLLAWTLTVAESGTVVLPKPGCGNGGLRWDDVKPELEAVFDQRLLYPSGYRTAGDRFVVVTP